MVAHPSRTASVRRSNSMMASYQAGALSQHLTTLRTLRLASLRSRSLGIVPAGERVDSPAANLDCCGFPGQHPRHSQSCLKEFQRKGGLSSRYGSTAGAIRMRSLYALRPLAKGPRCAEPLAY